MMTKAISYLGGRGRARIGVVFVLNVYNIKANAKVIYKVLASEAQGLRIEVNQDAL